MPASEIASFYYRNVNRVRLWVLIVRACLKNAFCEMCSQLGGRFALNEGGVVGLRRLNAEQI